MSFFFELCWFQILLYKNKSTYKACRSVTKINVLIFQVEYNHMKSWISHFTWNLLIFQIYINNDNLSSLKCADDKITKNLYNLKLINYLYNQMKLFCTHDMGVLLQYGVYIDLYNHICDWFLDLLENGQKIKSLSSILL